MCVIYSQGKTLQAPEERSDGWEGAEHGEKAAEPAGSEGRWHSAERHVGPGAVSAKTGKGGASCSSCAWDICEHDAEQAPTEVTSLRMPCRTPVQSSSAPWVSDSCPAHQDPRTLPMPQLGCTYGCVSPALLELRLHLCWAISVTCPGACPWCPHLSC